MFLENFYGTLFYPTQTFEKLRENPTLLTGLAIVSAISIINPLIGASEATPFMALGLVATAFSGIIKWAVFAFFIELVAAIFKKGGKIEILLTLTAYALLPWVFMGPAALFKTGGLPVGLIGIIAGIAIWIWSTVLTFFAVMKAYDLSSERVIMLVFIPLLGFFIFSDWIVGFFFTLFGIFGF